ncbi:ANL family adenylate-forming protein [Nitrincola sp. A-D6]|uniref:ANL family adenylate-forming protein n=1 Tax=Nitrincola sp. A-D6 TaxID=1545442 RepID=UPI0006897F90|nr:fatty acid--CoA ligase family protein [Nitrincola sp. A-D6]
MINSFVTALQKLPAHQPCIIDEGQVLTVNQLLEKAKDRLYNSEITPQKHLILEGLSPLNFIIALLAFDGQVDSIQLKPATLSYPASLILNKNQTIQRPSETRWLLATSGTTGTPKLIEHSFESLTQKTLLNRTQGQKLIWGLAYDTYRFAGLQVILQALLGGSQLAIPASSCFADQIQSWLSARVNALSATPSLWRKLLMDSRIKSLNLQQITLGGEIVDQTILDVLAANFSEARIVHVYASTEAGAGFSVKDQQAGFPACWIKNTASGVDIKINNNQHLLIKPSTLAQGNFLQERLTEDGYLDTEDLVEIRGDRVIFLGRASGAINVGGNKVSPEYVEACIRQVPGILEACVYGKSSSMMGQLVAADIVISREADSQSLRQLVMQHCQEHLTPWQRPISLRFVDNLNLTSAGKKDRKNP